MSEAGPRLVALDAPPAGGAGGTPEPESPESQERRWTLRILFALLAFTLAALLVQTWRARELHSQIGQLESELAASQAAVAAHQAHLSEVRIGAEAAGRRLEDIDMWWLPLCNIRSDRSAAIDEIAMTLASAGSHLSRFTTEGKHIPAELHDQIVALGARYHTDQHDKPNSANRELIGELGLTDYLAERFAVAGTVEDCVAKLNDVIQAGARQFWMSIHFDDKERFLRAWSAVIAAFR